MIQASMSCRIQPQFDVRRPLLLVAAVPREWRGFNLEFSSDALWSPVELAPGIQAICSGVGRANAAAAVAWNLAQFKYALVLNVGVCGALPGSPARIGEVVAASESVFHEEGLLTPEGFQDAAGLGFPLGPFPGNRVPAAAELLPGLRAVADHFGPIATVATCSGTDAAAHLVRERTGALAEAMEGAAVTATAARLGVAAGELRVVSNTTGDRPNQVWDLAGAVEALAGALRRLLDLPG
jgi:futalosine hydrolase